MSKLSFKQFLESDGYSMNEGIFNLFKKKEEFELGPDGKPLLDKDGNKVKKLSKFAKGRLAARADADAKDPTKPRSEKQANDALSDTADAAKKTKTVLGAQSKSFR